MINLDHVKSFCKDFTQIENYEKAINDTTQTWICHHRLGEIVSREYLIEHNDYYNISPNELIFVTKAEHNTIHKKGKEGNVGSKNGMYGKHHTKEAKQKISTKNKGNQVWLGRKHSEESKKKMSEAMKGHIPTLGFAGKCHSEEARRKISEAQKGNQYNKGRHWYNNGRSETLEKVCPPGFVPGRIKH
jgi:hypothetical protein